MKEKLAEAAKAQAEKLTEGLGDTLKEAAQEQISNLGNMLAEARAELDSEKQKQTAAIEAQQKEIAALMDALKLSREKLDDALHHRAKVEAQLHEARDQIAALQAGGSATQNEGYY